MQNIYSTAQSPYYSSAPRMTTPPLSKNHKDLSDDSQDSTGSEDKNPIFLQYYLYLYTKLALFTSKKISMFLKDFLIVGAMSGQALAVEN